MRIAWLVAVVLLSSLLAAQSAVAQKITVDPDAPKGAIVYAVDYVNLALRDSSKRRFTSRVTSQ